MQTTHTRIHKTGSRIRTDGFQSTISKSSFELPLFLAMRSPPIPLNVAGLATAPRLIRPDSVCALYVQIRWEENTKVNCVLSNAADQNRQNILLVGSNRGLHSYCQLGRPCALRFKRAALVRRLISPRRKMDVFASGVTQSSARCSWLSASRLAERRSHLRAVRLGRPLITRNDLICVEGVIFTGLDRLPEGGRGLLVVKHRAEIARCRTSLTTKSYFKFDIGKH